MPSWKAIPGNIPVCCCHPPQHKFRLEVIRPITKDVISVKCVIQIEQQVRQGFTDCRERLCEVIRNIIMGGIAYHPILVCRLLLLNSDPFPNETNEDERLLLLVVVLLELFKRGMHGFRRIINKDYTMSRREVLQQLPRAVSLHWLANRCFVYIRTSFLKSIMNPLSGSVFSTDFRSLTFPSVTFLNSMKDTSLRSCGADRLLGNKHRCIFLLQ